MSSTSPHYPPLSLDELERTFGVLFVGFVVATVCYGFTFFQSYVYFSRYPKDNVWIKATIALLSALDTTTSGLISQALYYYLIDGFLSPVGLLNATTTFCAENALAILATFIVQLFFAVRVWAISNRSRTIPVLIAFTASIAFSFGVTMSAQIFRQRRLTDLATTRMETVAGISQGFASLADIIIVGALSFYLQPKRIPSIKTPEGWFDTTISILVNRGVIMTVIQLAYFCVFIAMPSKQIWMPFHLISSKVYINTLLAILNSREVFRGRGMHEEESVSQRKSSSGVLSSSEGTHSGAIHFSKAAINATVELEAREESQIDASQEGKKSGFGDEEIGSVHDSSFTQKASLAPEVE